MLCSLNIDLTQMILRLNVLSEGHVTALLFFSALTIQTIQNVVQSECVQLNAGQNEKITKIHRKQSGFIYTLL